MRRALDFMKELGIRRSRRSPRLEHTVPVNIIRRETKFQAFATGVNRHGMFIRTTVAAELNYLVQLEVVLPSGTFKALATAKSRSGEPDDADGDGLGVEFFAIDPASKSMWETYYQGLRRSKQA